MCGRFTVAQPASAIAEALAVQDFPSVSDWAPNWNAGPGQQIAVLDAVDDRRRLRLMHWGMPLAASRMVINARSETILDKPMFRDLTRTNRCLIPASGWYEWDRSEKRPQPWYHTISDLPLLLMAALWRQEATGSICVIVLTQPAVSEISHIHDRMPVILATEAADAWLGPGAMPAAVITPPKRRPAIWPVTQDVNGVACNRPENILPIAPPLRQLDLFG